MPKKAVKSPLIKEPTIEQSNRAADAESRVYVRETTYTQARKNLATYCNQVASTREPVIIHRRGADDVALISVDELNSLSETAHLLRSPKNAQRLLRALNRALNDDTPPQSIEELQRESGIGSEEK